MRRPFRVELDIIIVRTVSYTIRAHFFFFFFFFSGRLSCAYEDEVAVRPSSSRLFQRRFESRDAVREDEGEESCSAFLPLSSLLRSLARRRRKPKPVVRRPSSRFSTYDFFCSTQDFLLRAVPFLVREKRKKSFCYLQQATRCFSASPKENGASFEAVPTKILPFPSKANLRGLIKKKHYG